MYLSKRAVSAGVASVLGVVSTIASAALPTAATDAITALETDGTAMVAAFWPVLVAIVGGLVLMKIFKKGLGKAT